MPDETTTALINELDWARADLVATLDGISERDARRPLTVSGTNLLGLVAHMTMSEAVYLGSLLGHPLEGHERRFDDPGFANRDSLWVEADRTRADVLDEYARVNAHANDIVRSVGLTAIATVPWWPQPETTVLNHVAHVLAETARHTGHADILREHLVAGPVDSAPPRDADTFEHWSVVAEAAAHPASEAER